MFMTSGYYRQDFENHVDTSLPLCINSIGHYKLVQMPRFYTIRTGGREDFHLLYLASGRAHYLVGDIWHFVEAGQMIIYYPHQRHEYFYLLEEAPDIYWLHFTGQEVEAMFREAGIYRSGVWQVGARNRYIRLFEEMLHELQLKQVQFLEIANACLTQLLAYFSRAINQGGASGTPYDRMIEETLQHLHKNYHQNFSVEEWAKKQAVSTCWFIRRFKEHTGDTPLNYLTMVRIRKGRELLENKELSVTQIAEMIGYHNPFYFSRQFKKKTGLSPTQYRNQ